MTDDEQAVANGRRFILLKVVMTLICVAMLVLSFFMLNNVHRIITIASLIVFAALAVTIPSIHPKYEAVLKSLVVTAVLAAITLIIFIIMEKSGILYQITDFERLKNIILETKQWGILTFFFITLLQVVVLPIPAAITILIGVAIYGAWVSFFISSIGTIIGSIISFSIGRTFGKKIVIWVFGREKTEKYAKFLARGKFAFIFMMIFPIFPDDLICMLAGITSMSKKFFIISTSITRTAAIAAYCFLGTGEIIPFRGWGIPVWIGIFLVIVATFFIIEKILAKRRKS